MKYGDAATEILETEELSPGRERSGRAQHAKLEQNDPQREQGIQLGATDVGATPLWVRRAHIGPKPMCVQTT